MPLGPVNRTPRNIMRGMANSNYLGSYADHYYDTKEKVIQQDNPSYPGGQNGMLYRGGYSHDAGSFNIIHGAN